MAVSVISLATYADEQSSEGTFWLDEMKTQVILKAQGSGACFSPSTGSRENYAACKQGIGSRWIGASRRPTFVVGLYANPKSEFVQRPSRQELCNLLWSNNALGGLMQTGLGSRR